jgi:Leucine-rich repeat (LRR) protein
MSSNIKVIIKKPTKKEYYKYFKTVEEITPDYFKLGFITSLTIYNSNLFELPDVSLLPNLVSLYCGNNNLKIIPKYENLIELDCQNNLIEELEEYPNLVKLWCNRNKLTKLKDYPNLEEVYFSHNNLCELSYMPKLKYLFCSNNKIVKIDAEKIPNIRSLFCSLNKLKKIPDLPLLEVLFCDHNEITELGDYPLLKNFVCQYNQLTFIKEYISCERLICNSNKLTQLPNLINWRNLVDVEYQNNEIDYIPPNITRFLNLLSERKKKKDFIVVYNDQQNVHDHNIQKCIRESINKVILDRPCVDFNLMFQQIVENDILEEETKKILVDFSSNEDIHSLLGITFKELLLSVWSIIIQNKHQKDILAILNTEMKDSMCKCFLGRMSRLINSLNGFDERVQIQMDDSSQIGNIIVITKMNLEKEKSYTVEKHKEIVFKELLERGFDKTLIKEWVDNIDID